MVTEAAFHVIRMFELSCFNLGSIELYNFKGRRIDNTKPAKLRREFFELDRL
jgi:hypothetical protein